MTKTGFVVANLFRKRTRTLLTLLSVFVAFTLFGLLQSLNHIFDAGTDFIGATRLITQARVSFTQPIPLSMLPQLEKVPGVAHVAHMQWFGGVWKKDNTRSSPSRSTRCASTRSIPSGCCPRRNGGSSQDTAHRHDRRARARRPLRLEGRAEVPVSSNIFPMKNGSKDWTFDLVGIFDGKDEDWQKQTQNIFIQHDYFDEANQFGSGRTNFFTLQLADGADAARSAAPSTACTRTRPTRPRPRPRRTSTSASSSRSATSA
jgi:putative ABC transport system permease protein